MSKNNKKREKKTNSISIFLFFLLISCPKFVVAKSKPFIMKKEAVIEILRYDNPSDLYAISIQGEEGSGPWFVSPEELYNATKNNGIKKSFQKDRSSIVKMIIKIDSNMRVLDFDQMKKQTDERTRKKP